MPTLIHTAKLNNVDPQAWHADVLARIADHKITELAALLPWNWRGPPAVKRRLTVAAPAYDRLLVKILPDCDGSDVGNCTSDNLIKPAPAAGNPRDYARRPALSITAVCAIATTAL